MQALADFVAAQHKRTWRSAELRGQDAGQGWTCRCPEDHRSRARRQAAGSDTLELLPGTSGLPRLDRRPPAHAPGPWRASRGKGGSPRVTTASPFRAITRFITRLAAARLHTPVEVHQQECEVIADVDCRQLFIEFQRIERYGRPMPQTKVAQMQIAMTSSDKSSVTRSASQVAASLQALRSFALANRALRPAG